MFHLSAHTDRSLAKSAHGIKFPVDPTAIMNESRARILVLSTIFLFSTVFLLLQGDILSLWARV